MNAKTKKRLIAVSGAIVIVLIVVLAIIGGGTAAKTISVAEAAELASNGNDGQKVQVTGNVVPNSYSTQGKVLNFEIYDPQEGTGEVLIVDYDGAASSTFGNDVTAICTGKISDGVLKCSELVTKCPSKYESSADALSVEQLLGYGSDIEGKVVKVKGIVKDGSLAAAGNGDRFTVVDASGDGSQLAVLFNGALSSDVAEGATVVLTGSLGADGKFAATDVALEG